MRRIVGLALVGLGAFLLVAALLTRTYVAGQLVKFPLNTYVKTTLIGKDVSYFSPKLVRPVTGATMQVTDTVKGDGAAGSSSTAVWDEFTYLYDRTNHAEFSYTTRRAAFDRRTAVLVDCCGANIGGNSSIRQTGLSGYVWPIGTQKQTYDVFDTTLLKPIRSGTWARGRSTASTCTDSWRRCRPPNRAPSRCRDPWWAAARTW